MMGRPLTPMIDRFYQYVQVLGNSCWEWTAHTDKWGYGTLWNNDIQDMERAHRFSYRYFIGPIPEGMLLLHSCDNPWCVNPEHVFPGTDARNAQDMVQRGRSLTGERNHKAKLHWAEVLEIRRLFSLGVTKTMLGKLFRISDVQAGYIVRNKNWSSTWVSQ